MYLAENEVVKLIRKVEASMHISELFNNYSSSYSINQFLSQFNTTLKEGAIAYDKGEKIIVPEEAKQHQWNDGDEMVSLLMLEVTVK